MLCNPPVIAALVMLGFTCTGCGDSGAPTPPSPDDTPEALQIVSGDGQRAGIGTPLTLPLRIRVIGSDDEPFAGAVVQWSVTEGQATLDPAQSTTDAGGEAETRVTLGATTGSVAISASVQNLAPVTFSVTALETSSFVSVSAGAAHTCGVTAAGDAYCWGTNLAGQLGDGSPLGTIRVSPVLVAGGLSFASISAGGLHTCGLTTTGAAYCWGSNADGQMVERLTPVPVATGLTFALLVTGDPTCGITTEAETYCWRPGFNNAQPALVGPHLSFVDLDVGNEHACGLTEEGRAYCWGLNAFGELGDGTTMNRADPVPVSGDLRFVSLGVGALHTCGITDGGAAYCWGWHAGAELGIGTTGAPAMCGQYPCSTVPLPVTGGLSFARLSGGVDNSHQCGLTGAGAAYCWGLNYSGQLGNGTLAGNDTCYPRGPADLGYPCSTVPAAVVGGLTFVSVSAGASHTCGITAEGAAYCWGNNRGGQLGDGSSTSQRSSPVPVSMN
jgi:alpha-tubulin suppressor-like RCC1 family protein